ncbi:excinuclease ABC subunit UvrB [Ureaplasma canigenitalium]|uniref:excinuclease ABC subunit UvrB n=1 Tax=Ureaplasma canigenitalium TaxID=42092 RepID=UPI0004E104C4|nr:excinuclease ABC subunit UvrB [Ureaplasma canigenitalium]
MENKNEFKIASSYQPSGDQVTAIPKLVNNIKNKQKHQVLLGATGTGKTFTIANVIEQTKMKTLVLAHNKTLAAQLYSELKEFFPNNKVEYFVSYFDYYQPEAYLPTSDTYIEQDALTNKEIMLMRLSTINSLATRDDVIVVASVACIYASISPKEFINNSIILTVNEDIDLKGIKHKLVLLGYTFEPNNLNPGTFRIKGDVFEIMMGYSDEFKIRFSLFGNTIESIDRLHPLTNKLIESLKTFTIRSANEYFFNGEHMAEALKGIRDELVLVEKDFIKQNKLLEANRIVARTNSDLEAIEEFGYCKGLENYYRYLERREPNETPWTIFDFFNFKNDDWLLVVDESHMSLPQVKGMHNTNQSRKSTLIEYGFRLPSAMDNRPLNYDEFYKSMSYVIYVSATPNDEEINNSNNTIVDQIVRPTGLLDPIIEIRDEEHQVDDLINEILKIKDRNERAFVVVLTIDMAVRLTELLNQTIIKAAYLHNELKTLERTSVLNKLRRGIYDVVVGINLLREGLDLPEISTVFIFDANKPSFFRSDKSLIQIIGRAARNKNGKVIMYASTITPAMQIAIKETKRRREIQEQYNALHNITPKTIIKPIPPDLVDEIKDSQKIKYSLKTDVAILKEKVKELRKKMLEAAKQEEYLLAKELRDQAIEIEALIELKNQKKR